MTRLELKALVVIDGGPGTAPAIERAGDLLAGKEGRATLLYLIPRACLHGRGLPVVDEWDDLEAEMTRAGAQVGRALRRLRERGVRLAIEPQTMVGEPKDLITRAAAATRAEVVILGATLPASPFAAARGRPNRAALGA